MSAVWSGRTRPTVGPAPSSDQRTLLRFHHNGWGKIETWYWPKPIQNHRNQYVSRATNFSNPQKSFYYITATPYSRILFKVVFRDLWFEFDSVIFLGYSLLPSLKRNINEKPTTEHELKSIASLIDTVDCWVTSWWLVIRQILIPSSRTIPRQNKFGWGVKKKDKWVKINFLYYLPQNTSSKWKITKDGNAHNINNI